MICKTDEQIEKMKKAGSVVRDALIYAQSLIKAGITTLYLDKCVEKFIIDKGAIPSFKGYGGFPGSICASVNDVVVHGIPNNYKLKEGDIISVDVGAIVEGHHGDAARTFAVGEISKENEKLIEVTKQCFFEGVKAIKIGGHIGDISHAIQTHAESNGYSVVRELVGHGIGTQMHEEPEVPNFGKQNTGVKIQENMCIAIEPMINLGKKEIYMERDGWTIATNDGLCSAHYENTIIVTKDTVIITTL